MVKPTPPAIAPVPQATPFRGSAQVFSPPWLMGYNGARFMMAQSTMWDALAEYTRYGVLQRYPTVAQPDSLSKLGLDRKIWRGLVEEDAHYAERLRQFKRTWKFAGNAPTLLRQLWEYMTPNATRIRYVVNGYDGAAGAGTQFADWWTIDGSGLAFERTDPCNWNWDDSFGKQIRFWLIVYRSDITVPVWGEPGGGYDWGTDGLYWSAAPGSDRSWLIDTINIVQAFKAAGSHAGEISASFDGGLIVADPSYTSAPWGPDGPFPPDAAPGYPMPDGTFSDPTARPPGAIYIQGL